MKNIPFLTLLLLIIISIEIGTSCKKDKKTQDHSCPTGQHWDEVQQKCVNDSIPSIDNTSNLLSDTTILVNASDVISSTVNSITVNAAGFTKLPTVGSILIAPPCSGAEYGFMQRVTSITESQNKLVCQTEYCGLNEAFQQLNFDQTYNDTFTSDKTARGTVAGPTLSLIFANKVLAPGLTFSGVVKVNIPSVTLTYHRKKGSILPEYALIKAELNTEGSGLQITNSSENEIKLLSADTLATYYLPIIDVPIPIVTPVGVIVIPIPFGQNVYITTLPLTINGKATFNITPVISSVLGSEFVDGSWRNISSISIKSADNSLFCKNNFSANLSATSDLTIFSPIYSIAPFSSDLLSAFFEVPNKLTFIVQSNSPNYSLDYNLNVKGGVKTKIWDGLDQTFDASLNLIKENIAQGDFVSCKDTLATLSTNQASLITTNSAVSGGNITDEGGSPIKERGVCWSTLQSPTIADSKISNGIGTGSFTSNIIGLTSNTTYYLRAYAINSKYIAYGNEISINTSVIDSADGIILSNATHTLTPFSFPPNYGLRADLKVKIKYMSQIISFWAKGSETTPDGITYLSDYQENNISFFTSYFAAPDSTDGNYNYYTNFDLGYNTNIPLTGYVFKELIYIPNVAISNEVTAIGQ